MMIKVQTEIVVELDKIQKRFIWPTKPKIKSKTISSDFKDGSLKKDSNPSMLLDKKTL